MNLDDKAASIESEWRYASIWRARWRSMSEYVWVGCTEDAS